ncbi:MAG TPA: hypothetical protein V6D15_00360 [Oculatellaceae cyanobacterium]|jgi:hypothetical protein
MLHKLTTKKTIFPLNLKIKVSPHIVIIASLVILIVFCLVLVNVRSPVSNVWSVATSAPTSVLNTAVQQNYLHFSKDQPLDINKMKVLKITGEAEPIYLFNLNNNQLCGQAGCLYVGYSLSGKRVINLVLNTFLPSDTNLISVTKELINDYPCLEILQPIHKINNLQKSSYCYTGNSFTQINSSIKLIDLKN